MNNKAKNIFDGLLKEGGENAVSMTTLSNLTGVSCREVRKYIESLRTSGFIICSNDYGYFVPRTEEELKDWYRRTMLRVKTTLSTLEPVTHYLDEASEDPLLSIYTEVFLHD